MLKQHPWRLISILLILWLAFALRLYHLEVQSIWWDEGHSIFVAEHPLTQIPTLPAMDVHPPAYFALLHFWMAWAGNSEFTLRYLSVIFSLLTIAWLGQFARSLVPTRFSTLILVILFSTLSPFFITYAQEVRSYAMIMFLALGSTFALWKIINHRQLKKWLILYIAFTTACLYTHYFTIFLLLFHNIIWGVWVIYRYITTRRTNSEVREKFKNTPHPLSLRKKGGGKAVSLWLISQLAPLILFLPQLRLALRQVTTYTNPNLSPPTLTHFLSRSWQAYTVGLTIDPGLARWGMWGILGILLAGILWLALKSNTFQISPFLPPSGGVPLSGGVPPQRGGGKLLKQFLSRRSNYGDRASASLWQYGFLAGWLFIPLLAFFIILQRKPSFEPRYLALITPALFLLLGLILGSLKPKAMQLILVLSTLAILSLGLHSYFTDEAFFKDDSAGVAHWLAKETTASDIVYVDVPHPFHYYASRSGIPAPLDYLFVDIHTTAAQLNREAVGRDRLFWVTWWGSDTDPRGVVPFLAEKAGNLIDERDFRGYHVAWYDLSATNKFDLPTTLTPSLAAFGDVVRMDGIALAKTATPGNSTWATLHFTLLRQTEVNYKVSLRLRNEAGDVVSQLDRDLLNDRHFRTSAWPLHDPALNQAINVYTLPLLPETPAGLYQLEVVLYNGEPPYPSEGVSGIESQDGVSANLGSIIVKP